MKRDSFVLYTKITETVELLSNEQKGLLFQAILDYGNGKDPEIEDPIVKIAFMPIRQDIDANNARWEKTREARSAAGKKSAGNRTKPTNVDFVEQKGTNSTNVNFVEQKESDDSFVEQKGTKPTVYVNVNDSENVDVNENVNVNENENENANGNVNDFITPPFPPSSEGAGEGKPEEKPPSLQEQRFDAFYKAYPKKRNRGRAEKAWEKIKPTAELFEQIMDAVEDNKARNPDWQRNNGQYIPYPASWLNAKGWLDEFDDPPEARARTVFDEWRDAL